MAGPVQGAMGNLWKDGKAGHRILIKCTYQSHLTQANGTPSFEPRHARCYLRYISPSKQMAYQAPPTN